MSDRISPRREQRLADALWREAMRSRPEFSEALHQRVCRALQECSPCAGPADRVEPRVAGRSARAWHAELSRLKWMAVAAAAACAAVLAAIAWQARQPMPADDLARTGLTAAGASVGADAPAPDWLVFGARLRALGDLSEPVTGQIGDWVESAVAVPQWADLDHDALLTAQMLAERLPFDVASALALSPIDEPPGTP